MDGTLPAGLRGDYAAARPDFTVEQDHAAYAPEDHATWRRLHARQSALFPRHAATAWRRALERLDRADGVPDFARASDRLEAATGWRLVAVPGLIPDAPFFDLLARRRFPVTAWIRRPEELDYVVEPDVFHDFLGHVPLLLDPDYAAFLQRYGAVGGEAAARGTLRPLARLYWHMVEFGLIEEPAGLRAYGAGILSSHAETRHATEGEGAVRLRFDPARVLRSEYVIDRLQPTYFVIREYGELFAALDGVQPLLDAAARAEPIPPGGADPADRPVRATA